MLKEYVGRPLTRREQLEDLCREALSRTLWLGRALLAEDVYGQVDMTYFASRMLRWARVLDATRRLLNASSEVRYEHAIHGQVCFAAPSEETVHVPGCCDSSEVCPCGLAEVQVHAA